MLQLAKPEANRAAAASQSAKEDGGHGIHRQAKAGKQQSSTGSERKGHKHREEDHEWYRRSQCVVSHHHGRSKKEPLRAVLLIPTAEREGTEKGLCDLIKHHATEVFGQLILFCLNSKSDDIIIIGLLARFSFDGSPYAFTGHRAVLAHSYEAVPLNPQPTADAPPALEYLGVTVVTGVLRIAYKSLSNGTNHKGNKADFT
ncbi:hypothetical protein EK904_004765 [Melospiza melodia maxima]|nr:hypothetical protein EK904_004765 [Melospiza melodia maxima]